MSSSQEKHDLKKRDEEQTIEEEESEHNSAAPDDKGQLIIFAQSLYIPYRYTLSFQFQCQPDPAQSFIPMVSSTQRSPLCARAISL
jgi:hypothetical protein